MKALKLIFTIVFAMMLGVNGVWGQVTLFSDQFGTNNSTTWTTSGSIGSYGNWDAVRSGADFGARVNSNQLELTNDVSASTNVDGWIFGYRDLNSLSAWNTTLSSNTGTITWEFNMRSIRSDPSGFGANNYGVAFVLAGTSSSVGTTGSGYAVVLGNSGSTDPVRLARYNNGIKGTLTDIITSNTTGLTDFGTNYLSVRVTYVPSSNTWELFLRNDGTSTGFADPTGGSLTSQGSAVNSNYTSTSGMRYMGGFWLGGTGADQTAFFDNVFLKINLNPANYYTSSSGNLNELATWGLNTDGTGTAPTNFTSANSVYEIRNRSTATIGANWTVSGAGSKVVVGDGTNAVDFSIPADMSLSLSGDLTNRSTISGAGTVVMNGSSAQTISGTGTISNLTINNTSGGVTISSGSNMQSLTGVLTPTSGTLTTNGNLTLKSSSSGTAMVATKGATGTISGNVTVERYFASNKQAWRMVTAPVTGALAGSYIYNHWQSSTTDGATGVEIWGPGGTTAPTGSGGANGLAYHATVSSMREWNNNPSNPAYANVTDTKSTPLFTEDGTNPKSYFLFVAGPLGDGSVPASYSAVKVRATGALRQGNQTFSITNAQSGRYFMVGNPYASPVSHGEVNMVNVDNPIWLWDPNLSGANGVGGYVSFDRTAKTYSVLSGQSGTGLVYTGTNISDYTRLQSGQAFFVRATNTANLSVNFTEADKSSSSTNMVLRSGSNFQAEKMRVTLQRNSNGEYITTDGAVAFFYTEGATEVNEMDGHKLLNASNNIMFRRNGTNLTFEHRPLVESTDTLFLNLRSTSTGAYRLVLTGSDFDNSNKLIPVLQDTYLNKEQILKLDTSVNYDFEIDGNATASSGERFRIVFSSKATEPLEFDPRHTIQGYPNPVRTGGQLSLKFNDRPAGNYTVVFNSLQGVRVQQQVVQHAGGTAVQSIKLSSKLTPGSYLVNILDASSRNVESLKVIIQ